MSAKHNGFEGPLPSSIKLDGFHCHRRGGCDRDALCEEEGGCLGAGRPEDGWDGDPVWHADAGHPHPEPLTIEWHREVTCEETGDYPGTTPSANAPHRHRLDELAELVRTLTYAEMLEFAHSLSSVRGNGKMNVETLPGILHVWARKIGAGWLHDADHDGAAGTEVHSIDTAPMDRPVLAFMLGRWRVARWDTSHPHKKPVPFWSDRKSVV